MSLICRWCGYSEPPANPPAGSVVVVGTAVISPLPGPCKGCGCAGDISFVVQQPNGGPKVAIIHNPDNSVFIEFTKQDNSSARYVLSEAHLRAAGILETADFPMNGMTDKGMDAYKRALKEDPPCRICSKLRSEHVNDQCLFDSTYFKMPTDNELIHFVVMGHFKVDLFKKKDDP